MHIRRNILIKDAVDITQTEYIRFMNAIKIKLRTMDNR